MTIIAWDGKTLAADRQMTNNDLRIQCSKIMRWRDYVIAWTGDNEQGLILSEWFKGGMAREKWPKFQEHEQNWTRLIYASKSGCGFFERLPVAQEVIDPFVAFGSGRDFAMGAMAMGADARKAVEITQIYSCDCGFGVEAYDL